MQKKYAFQAKLQVPNTQIWTLAGQILASGQLKCLYNSQHQITVLLLDQFKLVIPATQKLKVTLGELAIIKMADLNVQLHMLLKGGQNLIKALQSQVPGMIIQVNSQEKSWIIGSSQLIRDGMIAGGKFIGNKLFELSDFLKEKIPKVADDKNQLSQQQGKLKTAKQISSKALDISQKAFSGLYYYGGKALGTIYQTFNKSQKGKQLQKSQYFQPLKQGAFTLTKVASNLYQGVFEGFYGIGSGTVKGVTNMVQKTHGHKTAQALGDVFQTGGNAIKIVKAPKQELAKHINHSE